MLMVIIISPIILVGWLVFYGISNLVGYLIPNPVFTILKQIVCG